MHRMWEGLLPVAYIGCAQDFAYGRIAAQVSRMQSEFQSTFQSQNPSTHAHRSQTVRMFCLWESVSQKL